MGERPPPPFPQLVGGCRALVGLVPSSKHQACLVGEHSCAWGPGICSWAGVAERGREAVGEGALVWVCKTPGHVPSVCACVKGFCVQMCGGDHPHLCLIM